MGMDILMPNFTCLVAKNLIIAIPVDQQKGQLLKASMPMPTNKEWGKCHHYYPVLKYVFVRMNIEFVYVLLPKPCKIK